MTFSFLSEKQSLKNVCKQIQQQKSINAVEQAQETD